MTHQRKKYAVASAAAYSAANAEKEMKADILKYAVKVLEA